MKRSINVIDLENRIQNNLNPSIQCKKETKEEIKSTDRLTPKKQHPSYDYEKALKEYFGDESFDESFDEAEEVDDASFDEEEDDNYDFNTEYENDKSPLSSYENVNHPQHYNNYSKEVIDMMVDIFGRKNTALFCEMNAFKYRMRMGTKPNNDINQDLEKEQWYLNKAKELRD